MSEKPETALIRQVRDYLETLGAVTTRVNAGLTVLGSREEGNRRVMRGAEPGTSDVIACWRGSYVAIECKVWPNKPTDAQREFLARVEAAGGLGVVAYSLDDVIEALEV